jgi:Kelch motif
MRITLVLLWLLLITTASSSQQSSLLRTNKQQERIARQLQSSPSCTSVVPSFEGEWESLADYPLSPIEAQGGFVGNDFVITGGFYPDSSTVMVQTWAYRSPPSSGGGAGSWERRADYPISTGLTHAAIAVDNTSDRLYVCGGYLGGNPGPATARCFVYRSSTNAWTALPDLPSPRGGGGLTYSRSSNTLIFSSGAQRVVVGGQDSVDFVTAWTLDLNSATTTGTWVAVADSLLAANHISSVTGVDSAGMEHYYFLGGQKGEHEETGNKDQVVEYLLGTNTWRNRAPMAMKRGHANAATIPYRCGIVIVGGAINGTTAAVPSTLFAKIWAFLKRLFGFTTVSERRATTGDISYYDIATDQWTTIGALRSRAKTVVCDIQDDYLYCGTGGTNDFSRRKFAVAT